MARRTNWENEIGRHLRLRDLHVLYVVVERGSMARAAAELGISQPAVSDVISNLEGALGVRLFDRTPHGVEPTLYGRALLKRSLAAFDELKQGVRDIEFLSDPTVGELRIGCGTTVAASIVPSIICEFTRQYPRVVLHVNEIPPPTRNLTGLRERQCDLILGRWQVQSPPDPRDDDLNVEALFDDPLVVATGPQTRLARRRKVDLAELIDEPWILPGPNTWNHAGVAEAFRNRHLAMPKINLVTASVHISSCLLANGHFVTAAAKSLAERYALKILPIDLSVRPVPVAILTLKNRTLSPVVQRFSECARDVVARQLPALHKGRIST